MSTFTLPQDLKIVVALQPVSMNAAVTGDYVNLKNVAGKVWMVANITTCSTGGTSEAVFGINEALTVAGGGSTASTEAFKWWKNIATTDSDTLVAQTAGATLTLSTGVTDQQVVCQIDPAQLSTGVDAICVTCTATTVAANYVSANYYMETQYKKATPPAAITS